MLVRMAASRGYPSQSYLTAKPYRRAMARTKSRRRQRSGDILIPTVPTAQEVIDKAFRKATMVQVADRDALFRARKTAVARVTSVADTIDHVLGRTANSFKVLDGLHPFYVEVLSTQFDMRALRRAVANLDWCRGQVREVAQKAAAQLNRTRSRTFIDSKRKEVYGRVSSILERMAPELEMLGRARDALRALPAIDPKVPTVVVAGYPNVGKSALVGRLSTAEPEVASYPFTTTKVTLGHFFSKGLPYQVVDTPGILDRPIEERNPVERRALAAIAHLPNVLLFLIDPTEAGGTTVAMQERLLEEVRAAYPGADVVAVETKVDLVRREGTDRPCVSSVTGEGVEELRAELVRRLPRAEIEWVIREG